mmetsp:Transcript_340/g.1578  ORF Transcript_340/g.1578 Transcript_340/m.1578 type:complete len:335 (-) Transcript_340:1483-2487(-)
MRKSPMRLHRSQRALQPTTQQRPFFFGSLDKPQIAASIPGAPSTSSLASLAAYDEPFTDAALELGNRAPLLLLRTAGDDRMASSSASATPAATAAAIADSSTLARSYLGCGLARFVFAPAGFVFVTRDTGTSGGESRSSFVAAAPFALASPARSSVPSSAFNPGPRPRARASKNVKPFAPASDAPLSANLVAIPAAMRKVPIALYSPPSKVVDPPAPSPPPPTPIAVRTDHTFPSFEERSPYDPEPFGFRRVGFMSTAADISLDPPPCAPHATTLNLIGTTRPFPIPAAAAAAAISRSIHWPGSAYHDDVFASVASLNAWNVTVIEVCTPFVPR